MSTKELIDYAILIMIECVIAFQLMYAIYIIV